MTGVVLGLALIGFGLWAVLRGRRHLAPVLPSLRALPPDERIVLFLRSFSDDRGLARTPKLRLHHLLFRQFLVSVNDVRTEEQQMARGVAQDDRPTKPRPEVVTACVATFASFWPCAELAYLVVPVTIGMFGPGSGEVTGALALTGNPTLDTIFPLTALTLLWAVPLVLWMRRALRGGPVAVLMLQIMSIFIGFVLLLSLVPMAFSAAAWGIGLSMAFESFTPIAVLLPLQITVYLVGTIPLPTLGFLLLRREVREWLESRA
ncbi:hypothetical protein SAMN02982929_02332 [Saccharopolyspora kobensis]|uniref:Uncharacterized protein n=1 Tax=Saccharopolyspora kobensis TaxID=146035 RepID=A0A1H6AIH1_9PSEU|nr:hypothetical protein [Saccharopolyspora kobensis]SEG48192.1 hypothetical protein SAMN02982929_02332 [Saccharopolyspora kobensis]SFE57445.1 hypothetical protein SAMN05216506_112166 [Saccharopolyspora kobensis]